MKQARTWIVLIGATPEIALALGDSLKAAGYGYSWFSSTAAFLASDYQVHPRCVVVDVDPDQLDLGMNQVQELVNAPWRWPTVVIHSRGELPQAIGMMRLENFVFLQGPFTEAALLDAIRYCKRFKPHRAANGVATTAKLTQGLSELTPRELVVASEMLHGHSSKVIARHHAISEKTVELYRSRVLEKMHVRSTIELLRLYLNAGAGRIRNHSQK